MYGVTNCGQLNSFPNIVQICVLDSDLDSTVLCIGCVFKMAARTGNIVTDDTEEMDINRIGKAVLEQICRSRGGFASVITKTHSEFRRLVGLNDFASVQLCIGKLNHAFSEFEKAHLQFLNAAKDVAPEKIENYEKHYYDMKKVVSDAYDDYEQLRLQEEIKPGDSASNHSASNLSKSSSSTSSARLKVAARKAALLAKAQYKEEEMQIKLEQQRLVAEMNETQLKLESQLEMVRLQAEISAAEAEEAALVSSSVTKGPRHMSTTDSALKGHMSTDVKQPISSSAEKGLISQDIQVQKEPISTSAQERHMSRTAQEGVISQGPTAYAIAQKGPMSHHPSAQKGFMSQGSTYPSVLPAFTQKGVMSQHSVYPSAQKGVMSQQRRSSATEHHMLQGNQKAVSHLPSPQLPRFTSTPYPKSSLNPLAKEWKSAQGEQHTQTPEPQTAHSAKQDTTQGYDPELSDQQMMQRQLLDAVSLPRTTMMTFDGDPMSYWMFINAFESCVDSCLVSDSVKLNRLFEYCKGKAAQVIRPCALMPPSEGYQRARLLLQERFGNEYKISEAWIRKVTEGNAVRPNNGGDIQDLADDVRNCAETLRAMDKLEEIDSRVRMVKIVQRLPIYIQSRWTRLSVSVKESSGYYPGILYLVDFLDTVAKEANDPIFGASALHNDPKGKQTKSKKQPGKSFNVQVTSTSKKETESNQNRSTPAVQRQCPLCEADHYLTSCGQFKKMSPEKRLDFAKDKRLCFSCLKPGKHTIRWCKLKATCGIGGCTHKHSRLLHTEEPSKTLTSEEKDKKGKEENEGDVKEEEVKAQSCACGLSSDREKIALPIVQVKVRALDGYQDINTLALLDNGGNRTFCSQRLIQELGIEGTAVDLSLSTLDNGGSNVKANMVSLEVTSRSAGKKGRQYIQMPRVYAINNFPAMLASVATPADVAKWDHLKDIEIPALDKKGVSLIIGQDVPQALAPLDIRRGRDHEPYAVRTQLGWVLNGPLGGQENQEILSNFVATAVSYHVDLREQVEQFWKLDSTSMLAGSIPEMSIDDKKAVQIWNDSLTLENGHYQMDIPFKSDPPELPDNRRMAEKRLLSLGRRLMKNPDLHSRYRAGIEDLLEKGYAEAVPEEKVQSSPGRTWYLPHHNVVNPNKPEKLRIVFDCAADYAGTSLNKRVLQGPDLTSKLVGVLLRFREGPVGVMGDIEGMFHQVRVSEQQRDALRFLWWKNGDLTQNPEVYRMTAHLFGGVWSPSCASFALRRTAEDNKEDFDEETIKTVLENFYVDDCLKSKVNPQEAILLVDQLCTLLKKGGFRITKWISNSVDVMKTIPEDERAKKVKGLDLDRTTLPIEKTLGMQWDTSSDTFGIRMQYTEKPFTRRGLLSAMSSVYDPLGYISPFVLQAKILFQAECRTGKDWDSDLEDGNLKLWLKWLEGLPTLEQFRLPRCLYPPEFGVPVSAQLHHFGDASQLAYGAVSYVRLTNAEGDSHCALLYAKSRLAPIKTMTIPRLELSAAVVAVKMDSMLRKELRLPLSESVFWTDSSTVLQYIKNETARFHTFVANRVAIIHDGSKTSQWRYVGSKQNPADDVSRGLNAQQLIDSERWKSGPSFLVEEESAWPVLPALPAVELEVKPDVKNFAVEEEVNDKFDELLQSYSCWYRLRRAVAWLLKFRDWLKAHKEDKAGLETISVSDLQRAEMSIVKHLQRKYFTKELEDLSKKKDVSKQSKIYSLEPYKDSDGVLRVGGRLQHAPVSDQIKHPMILPRDHHVSMLIVRYAHEWQSGHSGREYVMSTVRKTYLIPRVRPLINRVLRNCILCKRLRGALGTQRMADLPSDRVTPHKPPFAVTGIDCFGPFYVKRGRAQVKRYGCIFTCLSIRAIHIEKLESLDSDAFVNALTRFAARRGVPEVIRCDNGTNFVGGQREIKEAINQWNESHKTQDYLLQRHIQWIFNPPAASHMGGVWERQIRSVRKVLTSILRNQSLDDERLETIFCEVESILNGRPMTPISENPSDLEPLSPNHLLLHHGSSPVVRDNFTKGDMYGKRWRHVQFVVDEFWKRWLREYLPTLQLRDKWLQSKRNLQEGDIVLILDESSPRQTWPLARVVKTFSGRDGLVRSAQVKTKWTKLTRPIHKLCLLEESGSSC